MTLLFFCLNTERADSFWVCATISMIIFWAERKDAAGTTLIRVRSGYVGIYWSQQVWMIGRIFHVSMPFIGSGNLT